MSTAVIVDGVRTPSGRGKAGGALASVHPIDLLAGTLDALVRRTGIDPALIEDVIAGCAQQVGEQSGNIARHAVLAAGWPEAVPATTINRQCGSSQQAATFAAQGVMAGGYDVVVAAGVEMMSAVPLGSSRPASTGERNAARYPDGLVHQGISAELVAERWKLTREELDAYSAESHRRAAATAATGGFAAEIVPVGTGAGQVMADETVRPGTTAAGLAGLRPSFRTGEMAARFPQIGWSITPGNSSPLTDGASAVLITSEVLTTLDAANRIKPYLPTNYWLSWIDFFRAPIFWGNIDKGLIVQCAYLVVFFGAAWANLASKDVTS